MLSGRSINTIDWKEPGGCPPHEEQRLCFLVPLSTEDGLSLRVLDTSASVAATRVQQLVPVSGWVGEKEENGIFPLLCGLKGSLFLVWWSKGEIPFEISDVCTLYTIPWYSFVSSSKPRMEKGGKTEKGTYYCWSVLIFTSQTNLPVVIYISETSSLCFSCFVHSF